jgi:hypothetical protein
VSDRLAEALAATRESKHVGFTPAFAPDTPGAACELVRDVVAMANSGGGVIVVGLDRSGRPTGWDPSTLGMSRADLAGIVADFVGERFDDVDLSMATKAGRKVAAVVVGARSGAPLVFELCRRARRAEDRVRTRHRLRPTRREECAGVGTRPGPIRRCRGAPTPSDLAEEHPADHDGTA